MDLNEIGVFASVVRTGSFTAAARALGVPKSTVSRRVSSLEERLKTRLLQRTTRRLSLTDAGRTYYAYCAQIVREIEEAEHAIGQLQDTPRGLLRVTTPLNFGYLGPLLSEFLQRYPEVQLEVVCTDRVVDLVEERFDLGIRAGALADSTLIARSLGSIRRVLAASRAYLGRRGRPRAPEDLAGHDCIVFGASVERPSFRLLKDGQTIDTAVTPKIVVNDLDLQYEAARSGQGIALLPVFRCADDLRVRRLERVLRDWDAQETPLHAVYPSTRHLSPKVKRLVEHLQKQMASPTWELSRPS